MTDGRHHPEESSTCLEDLLITETMKKRKSQLWAGPLAGRRADDQDGSPTQKGSGNAGHGILESLMKVHPCSDCVLRRRAAAKPHSFLARLHCWHRTWWPGWKIYQAELRAHCGETAMKNDSIEEKR
jgi:hypothetical protein